MGRQICVISGRPETGYRLYGPFEDGVLAIKWAQGKLSHWWLIDLNSPVEVEDVVFQVRPKAARGGTTGDEIRVLDRDVPEPITAEAPGEDGGYMYVEKTDVTLTGRAAAAWVSNGLTGGYRPMRGLWMAWASDVPGEAAWGESFWVECDPSTPDARRFWKLAPL
jgi:hypothetical protein